MRTRLIIIIVAMLALVPLASAKSLCVGGEFGMVSHDYRAVCNAAKSCVVDTFNPLGVGFSFSISRKNADAAWIIAFRTGTVQPDLSEGIEITVDDGEAMRIPFEFLSKQQASGDSLKAPAIMIDKTLTDIVMEPLLSGKQLHWQYTDMKAKAVSADFSLKGLGATIEWIKCVQGQ